VPQREIGELTLEAFGGGSGLLGLPGDMTPPSRFVRAAILQTTAPRLKTTEKTVAQAFHLMNNFDIPLGLQFSNTDIMPDMPSATQVTIVSDLQNQRLYYRTMYNATIRCIDLKKINFGKIDFLIRGLENSREQPIQYITMH
jgi:choloylglycine hydrolase